MTIPLHSSHPYRADIDGLRAIAVGVVVLYHAGIGGLTGGFIGVDVFFVISGYLITSILLRERSSGRFSLADFYVRRARRILPALFVVLGASLLLGMLVLAPSELRSMGKSAALTSVFASNLLFARKGGYFDGAAELEPLLMTWSLAIEEQYYLLWPLLLGLLFRSRHLLLLSLLLCAASFLLSSWAVVHSPRQAFYLLPYRAWELGAGALLAIYHHQHPGKQPGTLPAGLASLFGLAMVVLPTFLYDAETRFPGPWALPPVIGTTLLIWAGPGAWANRHVLSARGMVLLGLISYSLYLWHWPLLSFARIIEGVTLPIGIAGSMVLASLVLAILTYRYVETPFRRGSGAPQSRVLWRYGFAILLMAGLSGALYGTDGLKQRVPAQDANLAERMLADHSHRFAHQCMGDKETEPLYLTPACTSNPEASRRVVVWGDSHATHYADALERHFIERGFGVTFAAASGCPPILDVDSGKSRDARCMARNHALMTWILQTPEIHGVVLAARWAGYTLGKGADGIDWVKILRRSDSSAARHTPGALTLLSEELGKQIHQLQAANKFVVLAGEIPEAPFNVPACIEARSLWMRDADSCQINEAPARKRMEDTNRMLSALSEKTNACTVFPAEALCDDGTCDILDPGGQLMYVDAHHLSVFGAAHLSRSIKLDECLQGPRQGRL